MFLYFSSTANPNVFNFYVYLRTHPLLIRQYLASTAQDKKKTHVVLSGFTYGSDTNTSNPDRQVRIDWSYLFSLPPCKTFYVEAGG